MASSTKFRADADPTVPCPACNGAGAVEESYRIKGPDVRTVDCTFCQGTGDVHPCWAAEMRIEGARIDLPSDWVVG